MEQVEQALAAAEPFKQLLVERGVLVVGLPIFAGGEGGGQLPRPPAEDLRWACRAVCAASLGLSLLDEGCSCAAGAGQKVFMRAGARRGVTTEPGCGRLCHACIDLQPNVRKGIIRKDGHLLTTLWNLLVWVAKRKHPQPK